VALPGIGVGVGEGTLPGVGLGLGVALGDGKELAEVVDEFPPHEVSMRARARIVEPV
jgi:hypothetical protein